MKAQQGTFLVIDSNHPLPSAPSLRLAKQRCCEFWLGARREEGEYPLLVAGFCPSARASSDYEQHEGHHHQHYPPLTIKVMITPYFLRVCPSMNDKKSRQGRTTLIELSVVIAVLLLLVGVLFIGITAWKNGANKATCIVNLSSIQKAVRGYQNMNALSTGASLAVATMTAAGFWTTAPVCPQGGTYTPTGTVPAQGMAYMTCSVAGHAPSTTTLANW